MTATVSVGVGPWGVAVDSTTGNVFVSDSATGSAGSPESDVTEIAESTNTVTANIEVADDAAALRSTRRSAPSS